MMATDGLFDNLYDKDIETCIKYSMTDKKSSKTEQADFGYLENPQFVAECLAKEAERLSMLDRYFSPFAREARRVFGDFEPRGKPDDITVIVA